jgi:hypothetical protein
MNKRHFLQNLDRIYPLLGIVMLGLVACGPIVPATTPPQLDFTPGPTVVISDNAYETGDFSVRYPVGWRIVTGAADQPTQVVFVAPDEISTITVQTGTLDNAPFDDTLMTDIRAVSLDGGTSITVIGRAPADTWDSFSAVLDVVVSSVSHPRSDR